MKPYHIVAVSFFWNEVLCSDFGGLRSLQDGFDPFNLTNFCEIGIEDFNACGTALQQQVDAAPLETICQEQDQLFKNYANCALLACSEDNCTASIDEINFFLSLIEEYIDSLLLGSGLDSCTFIELTCEDFDQYEEGEGEDYEAYEYNETEPPVDHDYEEYEYHLNGNGTVNETNGTEYEYYEQYEGGGGVYEYYEGYEQYEQYEGPPGEINATEYGYEYYELGTQAPTTSDGERLCVGIVSISPIVFVVRSLLA